MLVMLLIISKNPYRAIAACLAYLPVGYVFATEPCTAPRSQGAGGLIYLLAPVFVSFVVLGAFIGGFFLRQVFGLVIPQDSQVEEVGPVKGEQNDNSS